MRVLRLLAVCTTLGVAGAAQAADLATYPRHHRSSPLAEALSGPVTPVYAGDAIFAPPCEDTSPGPLIICGPSVQLPPEANNDVRVQNVFSGIRPIQKLPYRQLFTWSH